MKKALWMMGVAVVLSCVAASAQAQRRGPREGGMGAFGRLFRPEVIDTLGVELGISDSVMTQVKERIFKADQEAIKLRADVDSAQLEMRRLMDEDKPDTGKVMKQLEVVGNLETVLKKNRVRLLLSVRELLSPEQHKKLQRILAERFGAGRMGQGPDGAADALGPGSGSGVCPGMGLGRGPGPGRR